jgi:serine/threonine-protein kinase HSL1 (negative regulator of Swe1 kinase)
MHRRPNDQKLFYWLLWCHREEQLENYNNNIPISKSDFHHLKPPNWGKRISTCQFTNPGRKGHTRSVSRFTVISNVKDTDDAETVHSYDPYNASRVLQPCSSQITSAKIIIHRDTPEPSERSQSRLGVSHSYRSYQSVNGSFRQRPRAGSRRTSISGTLRSPQPSVSSIRSHQSNPRVRANNKAKRGVDFSSVRSKAQRHRRNRHTMAGPSTTASSTVDDRETASCPGDNDRGQVDRSMMDVSQANESAFIWTEELEQLHDRIARDCDEAFRSSLLTEVETAGGASREASPFAISLNDLPIYKDSDKGGRSVSQSTRPYDSRPLPPVPDRSPVTPISPVSPMSIDHHGIRVDSVSPPSRPSTAHGRANAPATDRCIVSDPACNHQGQKDPRALPSIQEGSSYNWMHRDAASTRYDADESALETPTRVKNKGLDYLARAENTIRVVNSPSTMVPAPLNVRKVSRKVTPSEVNTTTHSPIEFWAKDVPPYASSREEPRQHQTIGTEQMTSKKRVSSWFRRVHKDNGSVTSIATVTDSSGHNKSDLDGVFSKRSVSDSTAPSSNGHRLEKKKSFGFGFFKLGKNQPKMYIGGGK